MFVLEVSGRAFGPCRPAAFCTIAQELFIAYIVRRRIERIPFIFHSQKQLQKQIRINQLTSVSTLIKEVPQHSWRPLLPVCFDDIIALNFLKAWHE